MREPLLPLLFFVLVLVLVIARARSAPAVPHCCPGGAPLLPRNRRICELQLLRSAPLLPRRCPGAAPALPRNRRILKVFYFSFFAEEQVQPGVLDRPMSVLH